MKFSLLTLVGLIASCTSIFAGPILDGAVSAGEYSFVTTLHPYVDGTDASGGVQNVSLYWTTDANYVYGAVVGDLSQPFQNFANIYVYSSGASTAVGTGTPGTYGDGNDVIIETTTDWGFANPSGIIPATRQIFTPSTVGSVTTASLGGVSVAYNSATLTDEFQISKSLLGNYDVLRFGGQLFAYEFNTGSGDRVPGALVAESAAATPEPSTWFLIAGSFLLLPLLRNRKVVALRRATK